MRREHEETVFVIPARYASSRFPGKPLALIAGVSLLERTWRRVQASVQGKPLVVATDDERIVEHVESFGGVAKLTANDHVTGTDRCLEVARAYRAKRVISVQGDEPLIDPAAIASVARRAEEAPSSVVNAMSRIESEEDFRSLHVPKVVAAPDGHLLYMSRAPIPSTKAGDVLVAWRQVCVYAFPMLALEEFCRSPRGTLEAAEDIEILRFVEAGCDVQMVEVAAGSVAVDLPEDVGRVEALLADHAAI